MPQDNEFALTLSCRDTIGIVHAGAGLWRQGGRNIIDCALAMRWPAGQRVLPGGHKSAVFR